MTDGAPYDIPAQVVVKRGPTDWIGVRGRRRPEPRLGVSLAGAGSGLLVVGALAVSGDRLANTGGTGTGSQYPGVFITLAVILAGLTLLIRYRNGALAAAGVAASAIALPPFMFFATFSRTTPLPVSTILGVSTLGWLLAYSLGPGRGHAFYLGGAVIGAWLWFIEITEHPFSSPFTFVSFGSSNEPTFGRLVGPDRTTLGTYSLVFALVYLVAARMLDRRDLRGTATPFAFGGVVTLFTGILLMADDLEQVGTGSLLAFAGVVLCYLGATESRRATNWIGATSVFAGVTVIVADPFDTPMSFGVAELVVGAAVILVAHVVSTQFHEPSEIDAFLSRFYRVGSTHPSEPPPPPAGSVLG